jgi:tripartite-type tricarboxylate transporter receptor subunit TctC
MRFAFAVITSLLSGAAAAQACPERNLLYWQAFPAGGESDLSARHQQLVLKKKCPAIDTIIQYKPGAGGGLMWMQLNQLPGDGLNIVGINLPHIVLQPMEGTVQYKTDDITPVYWFHYTPDALVVAESSPLRNFQDFVKAAKEQPERVTLGGSGLNSANHAAHERLDATFGIRTTYVPFKGTGDMTTAVIGGHVAGAMSYTAFAVNNKGKVRALVVAMERRHPLLPDVPTFRELGIDWVDGAFRGIGMPKSTPADARRRMSELWAALNSDPEMKELAAKSGFELVDVGVDRMEGFMKERVRAYTEAGQRMGLGK